MYLLWAHHNHHNRQHRRLTNPPASDFSFRAKLLDAATNSRASAGCKRSVAESRQSTFNHRYGRSQQSSPPQHCRQHCRLSLARSLALSFSLSLSARVRQFCSRVIHILTVIRRAGIGARHPAVCAAPKPRPKTTRDKPRRDRATPSRRRRRDAGDTLRANLADDGRTVCLQFRV